MKFRIDVPFYGSAALFCLGVAALIFFATNWHMIFVGAAVIFALAFLAAFAVELHEALEGRKNLPYRR